MRWVLWIPQIIETADDVNKEQLIAQLVAQRRLRGAADAFELYPVQEWTADAECNAPNGAAGDNEKEQDANEEGAEK